MRFILGLSLVMLAAMTSEATIRDSKVGQYPDLIARCAHDSDLAVPGYRPISLDIRPSKEGDRVETNISLAAVVCRKTLDGFQFEARSFTQDLELENEEGPFVMKFQNVRVILLNQAGRYLGAVRAQDVMMQNFGFNLPITDFATPGQLEQVENGESVRIIAKFYLGAAVATSEKTKFRESRGGAYVISFVLEKNPENGALVIQNAELQ